MTIKLTDVGMRRFRVIWIIILFACCFTTSLFATSYPSTGYGVTGNYSSSINSVLGTNYNQDSLSSYNKGTGYDVVYYGVPFVAGDSIVTTTGTYVLIPSAYYPGLLVADLNNDGVWDSNDEATPGVGQGTEYYGLPVGDGTFFLILMAFLYSTYILFRKKTNGFKLKFFSCFFNRNSNTTHSISSGSTKQ